MVEDFSETLQQLFGGFNCTETPEQITKKYIEGTISKDEFVKRMKKAKGD